MYSLSSHPVWVVLFNYGLPDEIINIINSYGIFYSPIHYTFNEFRNCIDYNKNLSKINSIKIGDIVKTIKYNLMKCEDNYINNYRNIYFNGICNGFFSIYCNYYTKETDHLIKNL